MKRIFKQIATEWEKTAFLTVTALFALMALLWAVIDDPPESAIPQRGALLDPSLLRDSAFAFLDEIPAPVKEVRNPFLSVHRPNRPLTPPPKPPVTTESDESQTPPKSGLDSPETVVSEPRSPQKQKQIRVVGYLGNMVTTSGRHLAHVVLRDPVAKTENLAFAAIGEDAGGLKVAGFSDEALEIIDPKGERRRVPFGEQIKVVLE